MELLRCLCFSDSPSRRFFLLQTPARTPLHNSPSLILSTTQQSVYPVHERPSGALVKLFHVHLADRLNCRPPSHLTCLARSVDRAGTIEDASILFPQKCSPPVLPTRAHFENYSAYVIHTVSDTTYGNDVHRYLVLPTPSMTLPNSLIRPVRSVHLESAAHNETPDPLSATSSMDGSAQQPS